MHEEQPLDDAATGVPASPRLLIPSLGVVFAMLVLLLTGTLEARWLKDEPWSRAIIVPDEVAGNPGQFALRMREIPPRAGSFAEGLQQALEKMRELPADAGGEPPAVLAKTRVIALSISPERLEGLLLSGRVPVPGAREALAGDLMDAESFSLDGVEFTVVGRLKPTVSGFVHSYLVLDDPAHAALFDVNAGATSGMLDVDGLIEGLENGDDSAATSSDTGEGQGDETLGLQTRTLPVFAWATLAGLLMAAVAGSVVHLRFFEYLAKRGTASPFGAFFEEMVRGRRMFQATHVVLYGCFFACMVAGLQAPLVNYHLTLMVSNVFQEGGLSYIGDAYASGDILHAAAATFYNNYVVQTLGMTFLLSVPPIALGALKTAVSFAVVGFAMAPLWTGTAGGFAYHCVTMILELEAYILAVFLVCLWAIRFWRGLREGRLRQNLWPMLRLYLCGVAVTGVMLLIAALYEAATLILLL